MIITPGRLLIEAILPSSALLPGVAYPEKTQVQILAQAIQETDLNSRIQYGNGPARSFWQFEKGTMASRGGLSGLIQHPTTAKRFVDVARARNVNPTVPEVWKALETDDVLGAAMARLALLADPRAIPEIGQQDAAWLIYKTIWNPGKPHPEKWPVAYRTAVLTVSAYSQSLAQGGL